MISDMYVCRTVLLCRVFGQQGEKQGGRSCDVCPRMGVSACLVSHPSTQAAAFGDSGCPCQLLLFCFPIYRSVDKSLARPGRKQATATEDFEFHISYL